MSWKTFNKIQKAAAVVCGILIAAAIAFALTGCSSSPTVVASAPDAPKHESATSAVPNEDIAATAGDISVTEQEVDDFISQWRTYAGVESDSELATLLDESGKTPQDLRNDALNTLLSRKALLAKAQESGITVSDEDVSLYIDDIKDGLGYANNESGWKSTLDISGYDNEEQYREDIKAKMLLEKLVVAEKGSIVASEVDMITLANESPSEYTGLYMVEAVFSSGNGVAASRFASSVGDTLSDPQTFRDAAAQAVEDGAADEVIEAGWTCLGNDLSGSKVEALTGAAAGQVEMWQEDDGTYHVGCVMEVFAPNRSGRVDYQNMPDAIKSKLSSDASAVKRANATSSYMDSLLKELDIQANEMPEGARYNVDMTLSTYGENDTLSEEEIAASTAEQIAAIENAGNEE